MAGTFTAKQGYKAVMTFGGDTIHVPGDIGLSGLDKEMINVSALGDGVLPFQTFGPPGILNSAGVQISCDVPYDSTNDGVTEILVHQIADTADTLILLDVLAGTTLLSGQAYVSYTIAVGLSGAQMLRCTFTYTGALTGSLVA